MFPRMLPLLFEKDGHVLLKPEFFEARKAKLSGVTFISPKPILQFPGKTVDLRYDVGTRGNGVDKPLWPKDLNVEIVTGED